METENKREMLLLEQIEDDPDITQASLADMLGVAVGTVNWHLKRLVAKGYVKVKRAQRRKLRYIITPEGIALRARLTMNYINTSFELYRLVRQRVNARLDELIRNGQHQVRLVQETDSDEIIEICELTCLEKGVEIVDDPSAPALIIDGLQVKIEKEHAG